MLEVDVFLLLWQHVFFTGNDSPYGNSNCLYKLSRLPSFQSDRTCNSVPTTMNKNSRWKVDTSCFTWRGSNFINQFHRLILVSFWPRSNLSTPLFFTVGLLVTLLCVGSTDQTLMPAGQHNKTRQIPIWTETRLSGAIRRQIESQGNKITVLMMLTWVNKEW